MEIEINGVKYTPRPQEERSKSVGGKGVYGTYLMMAMALGGMGMYGGVTTRNEMDRMKGIDIVREFELIQQKKSSLSHAMRNRVEWHFNKMYVKKNQDGKTN